MDGRSGRDGSPGVEVGGQDVLPRFRRRLRRSGCRDPHRLPGALATIDTSRRAILKRLRYAAQRAGERAAKADAAQRKSHAEAESTPPKSPRGHPDLVLNRAVAEGAITDAEADLIGSTRLEDVHLAEAAEMLGITVNAAKIRRRRAEARLVAWLAGRPVPSRTALKEARGRSAVGVSRQGSPIAA